MYSVKEFEQDLITAVNDVNGKAVVRLGYPEDFNGVKNALPLVIMAPPDLNATPILAGQQRVTIAPRIWFLTDDAVNRPNDHRAAPTTMSKRNDSVISMADFSLDVLLKLSALVGNRATLRSSRGTYRHTVLDTTLAGYEVSLTIDYSRDDCN